MGMEPEEEAGDAAGKEDALAEVAGGAEGGGDAGGGGAGAGAAAPQADVGGGGEDKGDAKPPPGATAGVSRTESHAGTSKSSENVSSNTPAPKVSAAKAASSGPKKYTFFVGPGNNSELVRATIERRPWWELGKEDDPELSLKWLQVRNKSSAEYVRRLGSRQFLNHLDNLTCIGRKNELYRNLRDYCDREKINIHEIAPPTFVVQVGDVCNEYIEFTRVCKQFENKNIARGATAVKAVKNAVSAIASMSSGAKGVDDAKGEGAADDMESLASAASTADQAPSESGGDAKTKGPKSPTKVPAGGGVGKKLKTRGDAIAGTNTAGDRNIWIVKPTNNNRGNGIRVFNTFAQIDEHLKKKNHGCQVIVQKYIERPLLYRGRKFDIRVLVMVDDKMQVYVYRNAYCRTSTQEYSLDNINDLFIHLTNYAVQKKNKKPTRQLEEDEIDEDEEPQEEGNNLSMEDLSDYLKENFPDGLDGEGIMARIREIVVLVFMSVWKKLNPLRERNTFEVFGWDFLLDEDMNVWLIEVNTNPYIGCSSAILRSVFTGMLEGCARVCLDPNFPPPAGGDWGPVEDVQDADLWDKVYP